MMILVNKKRKGFSLIETMAAALILSGGVVTLCALSTRSLTAVKANREKESAWEVLDRQLTMIDYIGIEEFIELGQMQGQIGSEEGGGEVYYWEVETEEGVYDYLYNVDIFVSWGPGGRSGRISAATALNGQGTLFLPDESGGTGGENEM